LVPYWTLDAPNLDPTNNPAIDSIGAQTLAITNLTASNTVAGRIGGALNIPGVANTLYLKKAALSGTWTDFTLTLWVNQQAVPTDGDTLLCMFGTNTQFYLNDAADRFRVVNSE